MRVKNRSKHQKKGEGRKGSSIYSKNKVNLKEGKDSSKMSTRKNEEVHRQGKKRRLSNTKYKRLSIQEVTSEEISELLCKTIYY